MCRATRLLHLCEGSAHRERFCAASLYMCLSVGAWQVAANVKPSLVIFVMDGSIGQAAFDQAKAFKDAVEVRGWLAVPDACSHASSSHLLVVPRYLVPLGWLTKMA